MNNYVLKDQVHELIGESTPTNKGYREVVIRYSHGNEKNAAVMINGDARRCLEDSLAAAFGIGRLIQAATGIPGVYHSGIPYTKVAEMVYYAVQISLGEFAAESFEKAVDDE